MGGKDDRVHNRIEEQGGEVTLVAKVEGNGESIVLTAAILEHALVQASALVELSGDLPIQLKGVKHNIFKCKFKTQCLAEALLEKQSSLDCLQFHPNARIKFFRVSKEDDGARKRAKFVEKAAETVGTVETPSFKPVSPWKGPHESVAGAVLVPDFVTPQEESAIIAKLFSESAWEETVHRHQPKNRRVQHFGYKFDYGTRRCDTSHHIGDLPDWVENLTSRVSSAVSTTLGHDWQADQMTLNEYLPGQGIPPHVDTHSAFHDGIASLSLGSSCVMRFSPQGDKERHVDAYLPPRSLLIMTGESRYVYTHGIPQRKSDLVEQEGVVHRGTRFSLTYRSVKREMTCEDCCCPQMCDLE